MSVPRLMMAALFACRPEPEPEPEVDTDGDGLSDREEDELGTDVDNPDSDGDGLQDGDEIDHGADPLVVDTDGDGYTDRDEVFEETDPADDQSVIYVGGWPYYFEKEELNGGSYLRPIAVGSRFARIDLPDQNDDRLDLFDFYNDTKPVVIDLSAQWASTCQDLSSWLVGRDDPAGHAAIWPAGPAVVARGDVYWITVIGENDGFLPATQRTARQWADAWPSDRVVVVAENDYDTYEYCLADTLPALVLLEPDLKVAVLDILNPDAVLAELARRFPE